MLGLEGSDYGFAGAIVAALGLALWRMLSQLAAWIRPKADALIASITDSVRVQAETNQTNSVALKQIAECLVEHGASLAECRAAMVTLAEHSRDAAAMESMRRIEALLEQHAREERGRDETLAELRRELAELRGSPSTRDPAIASGL